MNSRAFWTSVATLAAVWMMMGGEAVLSAFNERVLRARGAQEARSDVYGLMRWAYPGGFLLLALEGAFAGPPSPIRLAAGFALFAAAKGLKFWAMSALGVRWTYRVLVPPGVPLVRSGPYRYVRHPTYVAVLGEIAGIALALEALVTGVVFLLGFGLLIRWRIRVEEAALGLAGSPQGRPAR
jgi:methyltransferase